MDANQKVAQVKNELNTGGREFKVIKVEVKDPSANSYAVCTPVKLQ